MKEYFNKLQKASTVRFIVTLTLIAFVIKIPMGILGSVFVDLFDFTSPMYSSAQQEPVFTYEDMFLAIVFAPILETLIGQMLPIGLLQRITKNSSTLIIGSSLLFMLLHYPVIEFFPSAFAVGAVFAWAWVVKRPHGLWSTFTIVTLIHSMHNALVVAFAALVL